MELAGEYSLLEQTTAKTNSRTGNGERILKKATTIFAATK